MNKSIKARQTPTLWIAGAIDPMAKGSLHKALDVPMGKKIPAAKLKTAATGDSKTAKRARLALTLRSFNH